MKKFVILLLNILMVIGFTTGCGSNVISSDNSSHIDKETTVSKSDDTVSKSDNIVNESRSFSDVIPQPSEYTSIFKKVFPEINSMNKSDENNYYSSDAVFFNRNDQIGFVNKNYTVGVFYHPDYNNACIRIVVSPKNNNLTRSQAYEILRSLLEFAPISFAPSYEEVDTHLIHTKDSTNFSYYEYSVEQDGKKIAYQFEVSNKGTFGLYCDVY